MAIACNNDIRFRSGCAFENAVVRFVPHDCEASHADDDGCGVSNGLHHGPCPIFRPLEFPLKDYGHFREDRDGREEFEVPLNGFQIGIFGLAAWNCKGRNVDIRIKDDSHGQRS